MLLSDGSDGNLRPVAGMRRKRASRPVLGDRVLRFDGKLFYSDESDLSERWLCGPPCSDLQSQSPNGGRNQARALTKPLEAGGCRRHSVDLLVREAERAA